MTGVPTAAVTGGNRGLGHEVCRQLADAGWRVVLTARSARAAAEAAAALGVDGRQLDVTDQESVDAFAHWVSSDVGRLEALVNNHAGLGLDRSTGCRPALGADAVCQSVCHRGTFTVVRSRTRMTACASDLRVRTTADDREPHTRELSVAGSSALPS